MAIGSRFWSVFENTNVSLRTWFHVEVDDTYIGGKNRNRHWDKQTHGAGETDKFTVAGALERKGNVVARAIEKADSGTLDSFVSQAFEEKVSPIATDEGGQYAQLSKIAPHRFVTHGREQYVDGVVYTQTIDGFWPLINRGMMGSFHKVSRKYMPLYIAEFEWRCNNRNNPDIFGAAMARC